MSSGFKGTRGRATVSVARKFATDEGGTLSVSFPDWHSAIKVYAHASDGSMAIGKANAGLVAEAFNTLDETGLTPRQLAEQRAALLEAAKLIIDGIDLGGNCDEAYDQLRDAIALAQGDAA